MQFWNELEGQTIDGRHPLRRLVRSEGRSAWFETEAGDPQKTQATISLTEALTDADEVHDRLRAAEGIKHPNLVTILKVGQVKLDNTLFVYAVMEHIEQNLGDVLEGQSLSAEDAREVAEALVGSLTAIHQKGMSHGHVEAASVLATEETVKLRSDCLQATLASQADDVAGIGATLFHAFTQRKGISATDAQINRIPAPFAEIVRNTFAGRWTLAQVANALKPAVAVVESAPVPASLPTPVPAVGKTAEKSAPKVTRPAPAPAPRSAPAPVPKPPVAPPVVPPNVPRNAKEKLPEPAIEAEDHSPVTKRTGLPLYLALAVLAVLAIISWMILRPTPKPASANSSTTPAPAQGLAVAPATAQAGPAATAAVPAANGHSVWRVIAYTYRRKEAAAAMAAKITARHPDLTVEVFSPHGKSDVYLVSIGGRMDHADALKMRGKVRSLGMPSDSFVQNYAE